MQVTILAVTKAGDKFCVAGINENGQWVRPIVGFGTNRFWTRNQLTTNGEFIKCGDIWQLNGFAPKHYQYPNHIEDYITTTFKFNSKLSRENFIKFLQKHVESELEFLDTVNGNRRSLCLVEVNTVRPQISYSGWKPEIKNDVYRGV